MVFGSRKQPTLYNGCFLLVAYVLLLLMRKVVITRPIVFPFMFYMFVHCCIFCVIGVLNLVATVDSELNGITQTEEGELSF